MLYVFGDCTLDMRLYALHRAGALIPLGPKAFSVLAHLLGHRDRVVLKQELCDLVWPGQSVSDTALARCIASLRKVIGDTGEGQQIIQTIYGHGYRFVAAVDECPLATPASPALASLPPRSTHRPGSGLHGRASELPPTLPGAKRAPAWDGGLREVTVLCGALAHTEVLTARLAPEALHRLLCEFFERVWHAVQRGGGFIQTFLDHGFLALFGVPGPGEDHARQALQAALQLRGSLHAPDTTPGAPGAEVMRVRLGMHTGSVVGQRIGDDRRLTYTAVGNTIRLAMQLQQFAEPDTLVLSDTAARRVQEALGAEAWRPLSVAPGGPQGQQLRPVYVVHGVRL